MTFYSALLLGIVASLHCAAMCGGLQPVLQQEYLLRSPQQLNRHIFLLNIGRVLTYCLIGVFLSLLGAQLIISADLPHFSRVLRILIGVTIIVIGLQVWFPSKAFFAPIEAITYRFWKHLQPALLLNDAATGSSAAGQSLAMGMIWGLLPCGLVYAVLLTATLSGSVVEGAIIMLGFGLGTLPAMILTGHLFVVFRQWLKHRFIRFAGAGFFVLGGLLIIVAPYLFSEAFLKNNPLLFSTIFCITP